MKKLAFIDLSFHKKTKSSDFFKDILKEEYCVDTFYEESPKGDYDVYVYWQAKPSYFDLIKLKNKTIVFCPMYDDTPLLYLFRKRFKNLGLKIICFSKKLYDFFYNMGFDCIYIQYFLPQLNYTVNYNDKKIFFWYRGNITWENVKTIIGNQKVEVTIKNNPDPGYKLLELSNEDIKKYNVTFNNNFFDSKDDYYKMFSSHSIFIAPRKKEGIGMSFLESMSIGQCVIAYNESTMNEYIESGINGYLTDFESKIDISNFEKIGRYCKEKYNESYKKYLLEKRKILILIDKKNKNKNRTTLNDYIMSLIIEILLYFYRKLIHIKTIK